MLAALLIIGVGWLFGQMAIISFRKGQSISKRAAVLVSAISAVPAFLAGAMLGSNHLGGLFAIGCYWGLRGPTSNTSDVAEKRKILVCGMLLIAAWYAPISLIVMNSGGGIAFLVAIIASLLGMFLSRPAAHRLAFRRISLLLVGAHGLALATSIVIVIFGAGFFRDPIAVFKSAVKHFG